MNLSAMQVLALSSFWEPPFPAFRNAPAPTAPRRPRPALSEQEQQARLAAAQAKRERRRERLRALCAPKPEPEVEDFDWDCDRSYEAAMRRERAQERAVLREARGLVRPRIYRDIMAYLADCGHTYGFSIVRAPIGELQDEEEWAFGRLYIHEYCSGGYSGDDFAGLICIPLNAGKFLQFHYSC